MKTEINKYSKGQVYLLKNGQFIIVNSIDELTKMNTSEKSRNVYYSIGRLHKKGDEFKSDMAFVIENEPLNTVLTFDINNSKSISIDSMRKLEASFIGTITDDVAKRYFKKVGEYYDSL